LALAGQLMQADQILYLVQLRLQAEVMDLIPPLLLAGQAAVMVRLTVMGLREHLVKEMLAGIAPLAVLAVAAVALVRLDCLA